MDAPHEVYILTRNTGETTGWEPREIKIGDKPSIPWDKAPVEGQDDLLLVNGLPYLWARSLGWAKGPNGSTDSVSAYKLLIGYNVLASFTACGKTSGFAPLLSHPVQDRAEAESEARKVVTQNLSAYGTKVVARVVRQDGMEWSEPVAEVDGHKHQRHEAAKAILQGTWLPLDWTDEAGDAPTPPAPSSEAPPLEQEPTHTDDTIIRDLAQAETVRPQGFGKRGTDAIIPGQGWQSWDDRPFEEIEKLVRSLHWKPIGKHGTYLNPAAVRS